VRNVHGGEVRRLGRVERPREQRQCEPQGLAALRGSRGTATGQERDDRGGRG
jgi:hypothetical protein